MDADCDLLQAARIAKADAGDEFWSTTTDHYRAHLIAMWLEKLSCIRRAGLRIVEDGDGR